MGKPVRRAMVIGLDAPIPKSIEKYVKQGKLPNMAKLIHNGVWAENCLVPHPTITPPNWTTIATGAWPGTHGITCFHLHKPGMDLDKPYQAFLSADCQAEYIWDAAERVGKKSVILNYPSTWPPTIKDGIQIGGGGISINEWRISPENEPYLSFALKYSISGSQLFSTEEYPLAYLIELKEASGWRNVPESRKSLETEIKLQHRRARVRVKEKLWYLLVQDSKGEGYDRVILAKSKNGEDALAVLTVGEWSKKLVEEFETDKGVKRGAFRCKLLELSGDGEVLRFYLTPICQLDGWSFPEAIAAELENIEELPLPLHAAFEAFNLGWFDVETLLEMIEQENAWLGKVANYLLKNYDWSLFFMQAHTPDFCYHAFINKLEPSVCRDKGEVAKYREAECRFYQILDKMIGRIMEAADEHTVVIVTSDHGALPMERFYEPDFKRFSVGQLLEDAGLTVYEEDPETGERVIDWSRTKAFAQRSMYVYVNLKGRDPQGIVSPGKEYEQVCEQIISLLYDYTDPKTGKKPISLALRKEDARMLGLYGDRIGDIVCAVKAGLSGMHGRQLPTAEFGVGSMKGLLIMAGPNIKRNFRLKRTVGLTDIVPTICYLMELPVPKHAEGAIIYQALEDPNLKLHELETSRRNYQRLKSAYEKESNLTHQ